MSVTCETCGQRMPKRRIFDKFGREITLNSVLLYSEEVGNFRDCIICFQPQVLLPNQITWSLDGIADLLCDFMHSGARIGFKIEADTDMPTLVVIANNVEEFYEQQDNSR